MTISTRMVVIYGLLLTAVIVLLLCIGSPRPMGIANPSALYCEALGYEYVV
jgi:putative hemolysin